MKEQDQTKEELIHELTEMHRKCAELEHSLVTLTQQQKTTRSPGRITDTIDHKEAEAELAESKERLAHIVRSNPAVIYTAKPAGDYGATFVSNNITNQLGYEPREFLEDSSFWESHIHPEDAQRVLDGLSALLELGHNTDEYRFRHKDGSYRWMRDETNLIRDENGTPVEIMGFWIDITDLKVAEEALRFTKDELELRVQERTDELTMLNEDLLREIDERKRSEQRLQESEENFRTFFEAVDDMVIVGSADGRIMYTNPAMSRKLGYSPDELEEMHVLDVHPKELRGEAESIFGDMFRGERDVCPLPLESKNCALLPVETRCWFGKWSGIDCIFGICKDLSKEQEALQKFDRLFRNNPALMAVSSIPDRRLIDVNASYLNTLGFSREEVIGKTSAELGLFVQPEMQNMVADELQKTGSISHVELKVRRKDGTILDGLFSGEIIESQGQKIFLSVVVDITERKRAEKALQEKEAHLRAILNNTPFLMWLKDREGRFLVVNDVFAKSCGEGSPEAVLGKTDLDVWPLELAERYRSDDREVMNEKRQKHVEEPILDCGDTKWFETFKTPIVDDQGDVVGTTGFSRDITDLRHAQELLLQSERFRAVADLAGGVAHNFNNLLQIVIGNLELAIIDLESGNYTDVKDALEKVLQSSRFGAETVRRLQSFAGIRDHSRLPEKGAFDLSGIVKQALEMSKTWWKTIPEKRGTVVSLDTELQDGCFVQCDRNELFEVVVNLIKNATEALPQGGAIDVKTLVKGSQVVLKVRDTGIGMSEKDLTRLFNPFFTTKAGAGSGLGLASSRKIIEDCGGEILVESSEGKGTTFTILLPLSEQPSEPISPPAHASGSGMTILVIDDMKSVQEVLKAGLTIFSHIVLSASSGEQGLEIFKENPIDLIICDLGMPGMNGWEVGKRVTSICEERGISKTPFILLTGWGGQKAEAEKITESGVDAVVEKPVNLTNMLEIIRQIMEGKPRTDSH